MNQDLSSYLCSFVIRYRVYLLSLSLLAVSAALFSVFVNYQIKEIIDGISNNRENLTFGHALYHSKSAEFMLCMFVLFKVGHHSIFFIGRLFDIKYKPQILITVVEEACVKTMQHSLHWFESHLSGEIAAKVTDLQESIIALISLFYRSLINISSIIIGIVFLFVVNYITALVLISFVALYAPVLFVLLRKQMHLQELYTRARQESIGIINDSISNIFSIKIIGSVMSELRLKLIPSLNRWRNADRVARKYDAYYVDMADTVIVILMGGIQMSVLIYLYQTAQITAGSFAFIAMVTLNIHRELDSLLENMLFSINPKIAIIKSSYKFINSKLDVKDPKNVILIPRVSGDIKFENVTFSYDDIERFGDVIYDKESNARRVVFSDFNLHIKAGEHVGIVGASGAGKTTLIKSLLRYFDISKGSIFIDGHNIKDITQEVLRKQIAVIPQDITLFHRSILENLQIAKYEASTEEIYAAAKKARIHNEIKNMPNGYHSIVGERGIKVSGGQRQRIAIARAILKNTPILILDEATSALDTHTETLIQESIHEVLSQRKTTTIVIAHRLSTLRSMDRIIVLQSGSIVQDGSHDQLIDTDGLYRTLWNAQSSKTRDSI